MFDKNVWLNSRNNLLLQLFLSSFRQRPSEVRPSHRTYASRAIIPSPWGAGGV